LARHARGHRRPRRTARATVYGGVDRKRFIIETNGAGVALLDYDNDGWIDALVLNGTRLKDGTRDTETYPREKCRSRDCIGTIETGRSAT